MKTKITFLFLITNIYIYSQSTWIEQVSGVSVRLNSVVGSNWSAHAWICGNNGTVLRTLNNGLNWINVSGNGIPSDVTLNTITDVSNNPEGALVCGVRSDTAIVYRTTNTGVSWQVVFRQYNGKINGIDINYQYGFMVGNPVGGRWSIWRSANNGLTWDSSGLFIPQSNNETGWNNSFNYTDTYIFFGTNNSRMHYSTNNGVSWSFFTVNGDLNVSVINTTSPQIGFYNGYIGGANKILFTSNTGSNWVENTSLPGTGNIIGLHKQSLPVDMLGFYNIYASRGSNTIQYLGAYNSNWVLNYTSPAGNYTHISNRLPSQVWAVRDNGGISYCGCMLSGINMISSEIPKTYALTQNYPNPFNPTTNINFDLPNSGFVKLIIYDLLGREITRLVNQQMQAGSYSADWDAANYPSGVYFYSLLTEDFAETKKMVLVK